MSKTVPVPRLKPDPFHVLSPIYSDTTQLNWTSSWIELSCVAINEALDNFSCCTQLRGRITKFELVTLLTSELFPKYDLNTTYNTSHSL